MRHLELDVVATLALALLLTACGGGGSGGGAPAPQPALQIVADTRVEAGKVAGATALAGSQVLADISWSQVSGPPVTLLAARSPTVAFETAAAGVVRLRADGQLAGGGTATASVDIAVGPAPAGSFVTLRADHAVRPGSDTSVRAWPALAPDETVAAIVWTQLSGAPVAMDVSDSRRLMFKAPQDGAETVLKFRATMTTSSGRTDQDEVTVSLDRQAPVPKDALFAATTRVHPYRSAAVYAPALLRCVYDIGLFYTDAANNNLCSARTLPLLQEEAGPGGIPSVAQIMGRVMVSHDFLGANFEQFLLTQDPHDDFKRLLAGTSAIVIGSHVRPSFFYPPTAAIYLDAGNLWLDAAQRDVVSEVPDYRLVFDDALNFSSFARLVKNNAYARRAFADTERATRGIDELAFTLGKLLYHELGHAGDFFPPSERAMDPSLSIWNSLSGRIGARTLASDALAAQYPLSSAQMKALGQVLYIGAAPTAEQRAYSAAQVGAFFGPDRASDDYAYAINGDSSSREDLAMLFEEFMMGYRHGVQYDSAYTNLYVDGVTDAQVLVGWGERGRIAEPAIKPRIKLVLQRIAPWIDPAAVDALPAPILMKAGLSWEDNLVLGDTALARQSARQAAAPQPRLRDDLKKPAH